MWNNLLEISIISLFVVDLAVGTTDQFYFQIFRSSNSNRGTDRLWHWCFPANFVTFLRAPFFIEHLWWLLLRLLVQLVYCYFETALQCDWDFIIQLHASLFSILPVFSHSANGTWKKLEIYKRFWSAFFSFEEKLDKLTENSFATAQKLMLPVKDLSFSKFEHIRSWLQIFLHFLQKNPHENFIFAEIEKPFRFRWNYWPYDPEKVLIGVQFIWVSGYYSNIKQQTRFTRSSHVGTINLRPDFQPINRNFGF